MDRELTGQARIYALCVDALTAMLEGRTNEWPKGATPEIVVRLFLGLVKINEDGKTEEEITFS